MGSVPIYHHLKFGLLLICSGNSCLGSQRRLRGAGELDSSIVRHYYINCVLNAIFIQQLKNTSETMLITTQYQERNNLFHIRNKTNLVLAKPFFFPARFNALRLMLGDAALVGFRLREGIFSHCMGSVPTQHYEKFKQLLIFAIYPV